MKEEKYLKVSGTLFGLIAALHLLRILYGWQAQIGGWEVPTWASWVALLVAAYLARAAFKFARK